MNKKIAEFITNSLLNNMNECELTYIKLNFFLDTLLSEMEKLLIIFIICALFGRASEVLLIFFVTFLVRRYCGGNHRETFVGCLIMSLMFCCGIIIISQYIRVTYIYQMIIAFIHILICIFLVPVKSDKRPELYASDIKIMRLKGIIGVCISTISYFLVNYEMSRIIFMTLLFLLIDELVAGYTKGFTILSR